jgi:hypothetical protein
MNALRERYAEALISLHTFTEPQRVTSHVESELSAVFGPLELWCYVQEDAGGHCRLIGSGAPQATGDEQIASPPSGAPQSLSATALQRVSRALSSAPRQTLVGERMPVLLREIWGGGAALDIEAVAQCQPTAMRAISTGHGTVGLVILASAAGLPDDVAYEVTGHVAVALAGMHERSVSGGSAFMRSMVAHVAQRELDRANRYQRPLSLAVLQLGGADPHPREVMTVTSLVTRMMRLPDTVGRLDDGHLAVLLPETEAAGARSFLRRLDQAASRATGSLRGAVATCPHDGRTWDELRTTALARLTGDLPQASASPPAEIALLPTVVSADEGLSAEAHCPDADEAVQHRVRVTPLEQREVGPWRSMLRRLPPVIEVDLEEFRVDSAVFRITATSIRRLLRELRRAARTMQADFAVGLDETSIRLWSDL